MRVLRFLSVLALVVVIGVGVLFLGDREAPALPAAVTLRAPVDPPPRQTDELVVVPPPLFAPQQAPETPTRGETSVVASADSPDPDDDRAPVGSVDDDADSPAPASVDSPDDGPDSSGMDPSDVDSPDVTSDADSPDVDSLDADSADSASAYSPND